MGRGIPIARHSGNLFFRQIVSDRSAEYVRARQRQAKNVITLEIYNIIKEKGGQFVREVKTSDEATELGIDKSTKVWVFADKKTVLRKIKQALREPLTSAQRDVGVDGVIEDSVAQQGDPSRLITRSQNPQTLSNSNEDLNPNNSLDGTRFSLPLQHQVLLAELFQAQQPESNPLTNVSGLRSTVPIDLRQSGMITDSLNYSAQPFRQTEGYYQRHGVGSNNFIPSFSQESNAIRQPSSLTDRIRQYDILRSHPFLNHNSNTQEGFGNLARSSLSREGLPADINDRHLFLNESLYQSTVSEKTIRNSQLQLPLSTQIRPGSNRSNIRNDNLLVNNIIYASTRPSQNEHHLQPSLDIQSQLFHQVTHPEAISTQGSRYQQNDLFRLPSVEHIMLSRPDYLTETPVAARLPTDNQTTSNEAKSITDPVFKDSLEPRRKRSRQDSNRK